MLTILFILGEQTIPIYKVLLEQSVDEDSVQIGLSFDLKGHATFTKNIKIIPNVFSDHSALGLFLSPEEKKDQRGPGFWKCNNLLLTDKDSYGADF